MANTRKTVDEMEFPYPHNEGLNVLCVCVNFQKEKKEPWHSLFSYTSQHNYATMKLIPLTLSWMLQISDVSHNYTKYRCSIAIQMLINMQKHVK